MTFLTGAFLLAGLAAAIPIALHMINQRQAKDLPFPTLRFLRISVEKTRRRRRIQDLLLLLLRVAVLLLIALGLAEPTLTNLSNFWGGGDSAVAIVLDNSASMGAIDSDEPRFETALGAAMEILDELRDGDQVALFLPCGPSFPEEGRLSRSAAAVREMLDDTQAGSDSTAEASPESGDVDTQAQVRQMLGQVAASYEKADLAIKVQEARKVLAKSDASNKQIYVITDMQDLCWEGLAPKKESAADSFDAAPGASEASNDEDDDARDIPVIVVNCNRQPKPNVALTNVDVKMAVPIAGVPIAATAELANTSTVEQQRSLEFFVDGVKQYTSPSLTIEPEGRAKHDFQFSFDKGGMHRCETRLVGDDGNRLDDRRFFSLEVDQGIPIAIVKEREHEIDYLNDSYYVERALAPTDAGAWAIRTTQLTLEELAAEPLSSYAVLYCVNLPAVDNDTAERLAQYVRRGGAIFWIAGDNVDPMAYNAMNEAAGGVLLPAPLLDIRTPTEGDQRDSWKINDLDKSHRALTHLVEPASLYQSVLIYQHARMDVAAAPEAQVLARLEGDEDGGGEPILIQRKVDQGSVTMWGSSAHVGWTNFPVRPIFLPLLARMTFELAGAEQSRLQGVAGAPLVIQFNDDIRPGAMEITPPSGGTIRKAMEDGAGEKEGFVFDETNEIGIYTLRPLESPRPTQMAYAINLDSDEVDSTPITLEELEKRFGDTPVILAEDPTDLSSTFDWLREGKKLWELFLAAVLAVLVFECFVSNWLSPMGDEHEHRQLSPGMRGFVRKART